MKALLDAHRDKASILCSYTTRPPRRGEVNGEDYCFVSQAEIDSLDLLERVVYAGNTYGTPRVIFDNAVAADADFVALIAMNVDGARLIKKEYGDDVVLFLLTMPFDVRRALLERRDGVEAAARRLANEDPEPSERRAV